MHEGYKKQSVFTGLLTGCSFPSATVVVTTRPSATINLKYYCIFSHQYKLNGFSESQIEMFIKNYFSKHSMFGREISFMQMLKCTHGLEQLAEVPLHLSIILKLFSHTHFPSPSSLTEIYYYILLATLQCHKKSPDSCCRPIKDLTNLPQEMCETLEGLEKLAFNCFLQKNPISEECLINCFDNLKIEQMQSFNGMGLLEIKKEVGGVREFKHFLYRYRVFQEYLAAQYLTRLQTAEEIKALKEIFGKVDYEMVRVFYAGITCLKRVPFQDIFPEVKKNFQTSGFINSHEKLVENWQHCYAHFKSMTDKDGFLLILIQCCFEAKNPNACNLVADYYYSNDICHIEVPINHATPYLLMAISYFMNHSGKKWSLCCHSAIPSGVDLLLKSELQSPAGSLWVLWFAVTLVEIKPFIEFIKMQPSLQWVRLLNVNYLGESATEIERLCSFLGSNNCKIIRIDLEFCEIGDDELKYITDLLNNNSKILCIDLSKTSVSSENIKTLMFNLKQNTSLQYLVVDVESLSNHSEIISTLQAINDIRREKKEKLLSLTEDYLDE